MRMFPLSLLSCAVGACAAPELASLPAEAATVVTGTFPRLTDHFTLPSATDWNLYTVPDWVRVCAVEDLHATGTVAWDTSGRMTGTADLADPTTDDYLVVPAGGMLSIPMTAGTGPCPNAGACLTIPLASVTASIPVSLLCTASAL